MNLTDRRKHFCPAGCGEKFHKKGVLGFALHNGKENYGLFEYECTKCGMSYELDIEELLNLGFDIADRD